MKFSCIVDLEHHLQNLFSVPAFAVTVERPPPNMNGELTVNCFRLAKTLGAPPVEIARTAGEYLSRHPDTTSVETIKAFVNFSLLPQALFTDTIVRVPAPARDGMIAENARERIVVEYSAPNTNKPQHLGHLRNNTLGQAMVSLLRRAGHEVYAVNLINDRGIHICKSILAYQRFSEGETPESSGRKGDHLVGDYYVKFDQEFQRQLEQLRTCQPELKDTPDEELFLHTEIGRAAQDMLLRWEAGDPEVYQLWRTMNEWVLAGFDETYQRLGVKFDRVYLESETYTEGRRIVQQNLDRGLFRQRPDGAVVMDLSEEKLGEKVVLRSDSTSVYVTQDIGTTLIKQQDYRPDRQVWVVGDEQIHHFKVLFAILRKLGFEWAQPREAFFHMAYGMVNLPSGKMKSREGTVVDGDVLLDEMEALARAATLERYEEAPDDLSERARAIGIGALKFMLLKVNPETSTLFDPEASVKFEGDTGPYILYAYARIASMLAKSGRYEESRQRELEKQDWRGLNTGEEKNLALCCGNYGQVIKRAAIELDTSILANYLLDLAKAFSRFYRECPVLNAESRELCQARLTLSCRVRDILHDGLHTLGIETLESM